MTANGKYILGLSDDSGQAAASSRNDTLTRFLARARFFKLKIAWSLKKDEIAQLHSILVTHVGLLLIDLNSLNL